MAIFLGGRLGAGDEHSGGVGVVESGAGCGVEQGLSVSRTEYEGFGVEYDLTPASDKRGDYRFSGKHGYVTDTETGMQLLGARYYLPAVGRFLTQDPIGHQGGLNLYAYAGNNPISRVDPRGTDYTDLGFAMNAAPFDVLRTMATKEATGFLLDFLFGTGSANRHYNASDVETQQLMSSSGVNSARAQVAAIAKKEGRHRTVPNQSVRKYNGVSTNEAFAFSIIDLTNFTEWQVGGFEWNAVRQGNNMHYTVKNDADVNSFLYHIFDPIKFGGWERGFGLTPMGRIRQTFEWNEPIKK